MKNEIWDEGELGKGQGISVTVKGPARRAISAALMSAISSASSEDFPSSEAKAGSTISLTLLRTGCLDIGELHTISHALAAVF